MQKEWRYIDDEELTVPNKKIVWEKIQNRNIQSDNIKKDKKIFYYKLVAAAVFALLLVVSSLYYLSNNIPSDKYTEVTKFETIKNEKSKIYLSDSTQIWLNESSSIIFDTDFNDKVREVTVNGELYFNVKPSDKKFIVNINKIKIEVLGTSFNIKTTENSKTIEIALLKGKIAIIDKANNKQLFIMDTLQTVVINKLNLQYTFSFNNVLERNIWARDELVIKNEPLKDILIKLENWYGVTIIASGLDMLKAYTFHLQDESLTGFLELFSNITPINYEVLNKTVYIKAIGVN